VAATSSLVEYLALLLRRDWATGLATSADDAFGKIDLCLHAAFGQRTVLPGVLSSTRKDALHFGHRKEAAIDRSGKRLSVHHEITNSVSDRFIREIRSLGDDYSLIVISSFPWGNILDLQCTQELLIFCSLLLNAGLAVFERQYWF
jgi:hypothetical protein